MILIVLVIVAVSTIASIVTYKVAYRRAKIATLNYLFMKDQITATQYAAATKTEEI